MCCVVALPKGPEKTRLQCLASTSEGIFYPQGRKMFLILWSLSSNSPAPNKLFVSCAEPRLFKTFPASDQIGTAGTLQWRDESVLTLGYGMFSEPVGIPIFAPRGSCACQFAIGRDNCPTKAFKRTVACLKGPCCRC